jgi:DNA-binding MarR family transcriptional regulator/GNAT superfamily N-acetyltransferase
MPVTAERVAAVRSFNRFYTQKIGVLRSGLLGTEFPLTAARILYELGTRRETTAAALAEALDLDAGYLSRILAGFRRRGLVRRRAAPHDGRARLLNLTAAGAREFASLDAASAQEVGALLKPLRDVDQARLVASMRAIERLLAGQPRARPPFALRPHRPGDMGWVVQRHGELYAREYSWDERFEALVAGIVAAFVQTFDPRRERCWIAEVDGERVGSVFLVRQSDSVAKLRLLLVEPAARGMGLGKALVDACIQQAREFGYRKLTLWTNDVLAAARHIYEKAGFKRVRTERHHSFGHDLVAETWDLKL